MKVPPPLQLIAPARTLILRLFQSCPLAGKPVMLKLSRVMCALAPKPTSPKAPPPTVGAVPKKLTLISDVAPLKAKSPMDVTLAGMLMEVRAVASWKELGPIDSTPSGMETEDSEVASKKALLPIDPTLLGTKYEAEVLPTG